MTEAKEMPVYNPMSNDYVDCYCEFELHIENKRLLSATLTSAISPVEVELYRYIPVDERAEIEEKFELRYREDMA